MEPTQTMPFLLDQQDEARTSGFFNTSDLVTSVSPTLNPFLQDLSWIEPPAVPNASHYKDRDFGQCQVLFETCRVRVVVEVYLLVPLCIMGLVGNTLAFLVLKWDSLNVAVSMQLQALALADNFYLVCCIWYQTLHTISDCTTWSHLLMRYFNVMEPYMWPIASIAHMCTVWMVAMITLDRYFAICRPFHKKIIGTPSRVRKAVLVIVVASVLYNIPRFFEYKGAVLQPAFCQQAMRYYANKTDLRLDKIYYITYKTCCYLVFRILIPFSILIILNSSLIRSLHNIYKEHVTLTNSHTTQRNDHFSLLLVSMVTAFIICEIPDVTLRVVSTLNQFMSWKLNLFQATTASNFLLAFNSSINCLIYCLVARRFRKILYRHFLRLCSSGYGQKKSFSSINSVQMRRDTSHELLRFTTTCDPASENTAFVKTTGGIDASGRSNCEVLMNSNGISSKDATHV